MNGQKKVPRRHIYPRNRRLNALKRKSANKPILEDRKKEERLQLPSWAEENSDDEYWDGGYNTRGYDRQGYSMLGFNKHGFRKTDYGPDGFNAFGFDCEGYSREGRNVSGLTRADYDKRGYDAYGMDCYGFDRQGLNRYGYSTADYDVNKVDKHGYTRDGLYFGIPGTALIPLRYSKVLRGKKDDVYRGEFYGKLREHANMIVVNAKLEHEKLLKYHELMTELSLRWTIGSIFYSTGAGAL